MTTKYLMLLLGALTAATQSFSMAGDNRYFPWYGQSYARTVEKRSNFQTELFFMTGDEAFGNSSKEKKGIPEIWGTYDQKLLSEAIIAIGLTTPLLAQWQVQRVIEWDVNQKIEAQGLNLKGEWALTKRFSIGASGGLMRVNCNQTFKIPRVTRNDMSLTPSQEEELDRERRAMNDLIGLTGTQWQKTGLLDTEVYVRWGGTWDYILKSRQVDMGAVGGFYIPTSEEREINNSASIPFGGNNAAGLFISSDFSLELKEDWTFGMSLRLSNRFKKTQKRRLSVKKENHLFGATTGDVEVDEGVTFAWNPYFRFGDLQDGLGAHLGYTLATHSGDVWTDKRTDKTITVDLNNIYDRSKWTAEYLSLHVFYDSGKVTKTDKIRPIITFNWDIPVKALAAEEVSKTHKIALGIAFTF
jgi:hypothetical protein